MKVYSEKSDIHQKVSQVMELMDELGLQFTFVCNSIRISDENVDNVILVDADTHEEATELPAFAEFKLAVFNS